MTSFDLEKVLSLTMADVRKSFLRLFPLFLLVAVGVNLANAAALEALQPGQGTAGIAFGPLILMICIAFFAYGVEVVVGAQLMNGGRMRLGSAILQSLRRFPVVLLAMLGYYLAMVIGLLLLIIPGLIVSVTLAYSLFLAVLDDCGPVEALRGSFRLIWGNAWLLMGANLIFVVAYLVTLALAFSLLPGSAEELFTMLATPGGYGDWRRWVFDALASVFGVVQLFLNLHIFMDLKRLKTEGEGSGAAEGATVSV